MGKKWTANLDDTCTAGKGEFRERWAGKAQRRVSGIRFRVCLRGTKGVSLAQLRFSTQKVDRLRSREQKPATPRLWPAVQAPGDNCLAMHAVHKDTPIVQSPLHLQNAERESRRVVTSLSVLNQLAQNLELPIAHSLLEELAALARAQRRVLRAAHIQLETDPLLTIFSRHGNPIATPIASNPTSVSKTKSANHSTWLKASASKATFTTGGSSSPSFQDEAGITSAGSFSRERRSGLCLAYSVRACRRRMKCQDLRVHSL